MKPGSLSGILDRLPRFNSPELLVDMSSMDDAGVFKISDDIALVQSVDFFGPIVNSPYDFGQIVAANSLSDIYAMGATPRTAMNVLAYPPGLIPPDVIEELLCGATEKLKEAEVALVGGHTMEQEDFIFGMSVTGIVHPGKINTNATAQEGDVIIMTKPLGAGPYCDAIAKNALSPEAYKSFVGMMTRLNKYAAEAIRDLPVTALTDITGFGLLGHSLAIARNANVLLEYNSNQVPFLENAVDMMATFNNKGVCKNKEYFEPFIQVEANVDQRKLKLMSEAQTSGGLLIVINETDARTVLKKLHQGGDNSSRIIGRVIQKESNNSFLRVR